MKAKQMQHQRKALTLAIASALGAAPGLAGAAGFALLEQNASGLGNAYAGSAAVAEDASTIFYNPAGMTLLPGAQVVGSVTGIYLDTSFSGSGSTNVPPLNVGNGQGGQPGGWGMVPSMYFALPIGERFAAGLGVGAPFGLRTHYNDDWLGRYQGVKSDLYTINVNPSIAYKVTDTISIGGGVNYQNMNVELTSSSFSGLAGETRQKLNAEDDAWGWNLGALFQLGDDMRVGLSYRSSIRYTLEGDVKTTTSTGASSRFDVKADAELPDSAILSVTQMYGDKWQLLGDVQYTNWSTIGSVDVINKANGVTVDRLAFDFKDTWRIAFGVNYFKDEHWTIKGGIAYDESPVDADTRTVRLPDNDRYWLSFGVKYKFAKAAAVDVGYSHLFVPDANIDHTRALSAVPPGSAVNTNVNGQYDSSVDIVGVQLTWTF